MPNEKNPASPAIAPRRHRGTRHLDHGADQVLDALLAAAHDLGRHAPHHRRLVLELVHMPHQRDHDLGDGAHAFPRDVARGLEDSARLHLGDLG